MNKKIVAVAVSAFVMLQAGSALAETRVYIGNGGPGMHDRDHRGGRDRDGDWRGHGGPRGHMPPPRVVIREHDRRDDFAAGMMGFIGGLAAGSVLDNGGRIPVVRQYEVGPPRGRGDRLLLKPWTTPWYRWCDARYRSFDPRSGTYRDRDGSIRFCEARG